MQQKVNHQYYFTCECVMSQEGAHRDIEMVTYPFSIARPDEVRLELAPGSIGNPAASATRAPDPCADEQT